MKGAPTVVHESLFCAVGRCPVCADPLATATRREAAIVCRACGAALPVSDGVIDALALGEREVDQMGSAGPATPVQDASVRRGWARAITVDMDRKAAVYIGKYDVCSPTSRPYHVRRQHALEMAGAAPGRVLEGGCGPGVVGAVLAAAGAEVHGVDLSLGQLATAAARDRVTTYVHADLERLPYRDAVFETAILLGVLEYVERPRAALAELARVLVPGGRLIVSVPNARGLPRLWSHCVYGPASRRARRLMNRPVSAYSRSLYTVAELGRAFARAGLQPVEVRWFEVSVLPEPLDRWLAPLVTPVIEDLEERLRPAVRPVLCSQFIASAQKRGAAVREPRLGESVACDQDGGR